MMTMSDIYIIQNWFDKKSVSRGYLQYYLDAGGDMTDMGGYIPSPMLTH